MLCSNYCSINIRILSGDFWNKLITGYREAGIVSIENNPSHIIDARSWVKRKEIGFRNNKLKELTPATIPSFAFYHLMGHVKNLPQSFWTHLQETNVHTVYLGGNNIGTDAKKLFMEKYQDIKWML
jgi:hypothetical protein